MGVGPRNNFCQIQVLRNDFDARSVKFGVNVVVVWVAHSVSAARSPKHTLGGWVWVGVPIYKLSIVLFWHN